MEEQSTSDIKQEKKQQINTVLVIDDDDNWCYVAKKMLERAGIWHNIITASNGQEAFQLLQAIVAKKEKPPELIFLDLKMPVMDGFEFLDNLTKAPELNLNQTRIFVCSSSFLAKDKERVASYHISGYLTKPLTKEVLQDILS